MLDKVSFNQVNIISSPQVTDAVGAEKDIWSLSLVPGTELQNPENFLSDKGDRNIFCCNETTVGRSLGKLQDEDWSPERPSSDEKSGLFSSIPRLPGQERSWSGIQSPTTNDLIKHACIMKPPYKTQPVGFRGLPGAGRVACPEQAGKFRAPPPYPALRISSTWLFRVVSLQ